MTGDVVQVAESEQVRARWPLFLDGAVDGFLVAFAGWTLLYQVVLAAQRSVRWAAWPWLLATVVLVIAFGLSASRGDAGQRQGPASSGPAVRVRPAIVVVAILAVIVAVLLRDGLGVVVLAAVGLVVLGAQVWPWLRWTSARLISRDVPRARTKAGDASEARAEPHTWEHAIAVLVSLGLGTLASFMLKPDADDVFYVNRAAWIAEHGTPVVHDTMFSPGKLPVPYNGGLPTPSIEALQGSIAHALGLDAPTIAYVVWVPLLSAVFGWATWRLVRTWAGRSHWAVYVVAIAFVLASGASITGTYSIGRIWQGKVTAYTVLLPLIWMYLSRLAAPNDRARRDQLMLLVAGVCFVGFTTTSALLGPVIVGAGLLAAAVLRSRALLIGALALLVAPLINGAAQVFGPAQVGAASSAVAPLSHVFNIAFGSVDLLAVLGVLAVVFGPRLVVGRAGVVAAMASVAVLAAYIPGVLAIANAATNAGAIVWRLAIEAPTGVMVGMLITVPIPRLVSWGRSAAWPQTVVMAAVAGLIGSVLFTSGRWIWTPEAGARLTSHPTWKVDQNALSDVRDAERLPVPKGRWLLPEIQMQVLAITGGRSFPVVARDDYLPYLDLPAENLKDRRILLRLVTGRGSPTAKRVNEALRRLDVSLACVPAADRTARRTLRAATGRVALSVGDMACHVGTVSSTGATTSS
ncbi:DUF6077 domain-containing protein [Nocardioides sp. Iso805N]|uniref:DUF6077 domain-containing protein n=1 Tax=Nocardioides sp. Iso805N TaxID=1283287 RepID=UPI00035FC561|nr:DUF6077 domain-containing protein [Nocardioides sp. Iso805N]